MSQAEQPPKPEPAIDEAILRGTSTQEVSSSELSSAERGFFASMRAALTEEKKGIFKSILDFTKSLLPTSEQERREEQARERKVLEEVAQNHITHILRTASQQYFVAALERVAEQQVSTFENKELVLRELHNRFDIEPFDKRVKITNIGGRQDLHDFSASDNMYEHGASHRVSEDMQHDIDGMLPPAYSEASRRIAQVALDRVRTKMNLFDDAIHEMGGEQARKNLSVMLGKKAPGANASPEMVFYMAWNSGHACHTTPLLKTHENAEGFADVLAHAWKKNFAGFETKPQALSDNSIDIVARRLGSRMKQHDEFLKKRAKQQAHRKPEQPPVTRPVAVPVAVAAPAEPEPSHELQQQRFVLEKASDRILIQLERHMSNPARAASNLKTHVLLLMMRDVMNDERVTHDKDVQAVASLLLSSSNVMATAKALEADGPVRNHKLAPAGTLHDNAVALSTLYTTKPAAREFIDELMKDERVMLFATLTLGRDQGKKAISTYLGNMSAIIETEGKIQARNEKIAKLGTTETDETKLARDQQLLDALNHRTTLILATIEDGVRRAMNGERGRDIVLAEVPPVSVKAVARDKVPDGWKADYRASFRYDPDETPEDHGRHFILSSKDYPDKKRKLTYNAGATRLHEAMQSLVEECEYHRWNQKLMADMAEQAGFVQKTIDGQKQLHQEQFGITVPLDISEEQLSQQLAAARTRYDQRKREQDTLPPPVPQPPQGSAHNGNGHTEKLQPEPFLWKPAEHETLVIFDSCTLKKLTAERDIEGRSWLDLVKATSRLPNVRVVIPEPIAMFEMQGQLPIYNRKGNRSGSRTVTASYENEKKVMHHDAEQMRDLLKGSSYGKLQEDGSLLLTEGENKNIIVVNTYGDRKLYARIDEATTPGSGKRLDTSVYGQDEGEKAITRIVQGIKFKAPVVIISDDLRYLRGDAPKTTGAGSSVSHVSSRSYILSEKHAEGRSAQLLEQLGHHFIGIDLDTMQADLDAHMRKYNFGPSHFLSYHTTPRDPHTGKLNDIYEVITTGSKLTQQGVVKNGNGRAEGATWLETMQERRANEVNGQGSSPA